MSVPRPGWANWVIGLSLLGAVVAVVVGAYLVIPVLAVIALLLLLGPGRARQG